MKFHSFFVLAGGKFRELCLSRTFIGMLVVQQVIFYFFQRHSIQSLDKEGLMVVIHPAQYGLLSAVLLLVLFLLFFAASEPARDREGGSLETLFYGPVSSSGYIASLTAVTGSAILISFLFICGSLYLGSRTILYDLPIALIGPAIISAIFLLAINSFGIFTSVVFKQIHASTLVIALTSLLSSGLFAADYLLARNDVSGSYWLVYLHSAVSWLDRIARFIFPLGLYLDDITRLSTQGFIPVSHQFYYLAYFLVFTSASILTLARRGVVVR